MSKRIVLILLMTMLLTGCGTKPSWDNEEVSAVKVDDRKHFVGSCFSCGEEARKRILADDVKAEWTLNGDQIRLEITKKDGGRIEEFDINHEKLLHLMVISKDLSYFNHIHPEYIGSGVFEITNDFPAGGDYRLIADFKPTGGDSMAKMAWVRVEGDIAKPVPIVPDPSLNKSFDGKRVKLSMNQLAANTDLTLTFSFTDDKTNQRITDLEPYLGSIGHVVILTEDGEQYLHVHADEGQGTGPDANFETKFPKSGTYKIWGQFQRNNQVFTASYVVKVP